MTAATILNSLAAYLQPIIEAEKGVFEPSGTVEDTLAKLQQAPGRWRCILQWQREDDLGVSKAVTSMTILVIVQQARGLAIAKGKDVSTNRAGDPSILDRAEFVRDLVRGARFVHDQLDKGFLGKASYWLVDPKFPTRQLAMEFTISYGRGPTPVVQVDLLSSETLGLHGGGAFGLHDGSNLNLHA